MYAVTIKPPWAGAILLGKDIENRGWKLPEYVLGRYLLIHAGSSRDTRGEAECYRILHRLGIPPREAVLNRSGAIIGVCRVPRQVTESDSPWFFGPVGWVLTDILPIDPVPCRGRLGIWQPDPNTETAVLQAIGDAQQRAELAR